VQVLDLVDPRRICELMHEALAELVAALEAEAATPIRALATRRYLDKTGLLSEAQRHRQLVEWNATSRAYPQEQCIHELFEAQVEEAPDRIALVHEGSELTYGELNRRANQLARRLIESGLYSEMRVGICMKRSLEMVIAILGVLKAGGCYVPLDPTYPRKRLEYLLEDSEVELIVSERVVEESLDLGRPHGGMGQPYTYIRVNAGTESDWVGRYASVNPATTVHPANMAYVIYTSGSTGQPKGVGIAHRSAVSLLSWSADQWSAAERAGVLASTSICFDLSIYELFLPLTQGGTCLLIDSILGLSEMTERERVSLVNTVPSAAKALLERGGLPRSLRVMNLAGEPLKSELVDAMYASSSAGCIYDLYGPSESTTYSTYALRNAQGGETIGRPVANTQAYVVDAEGALLPAGVVGELYLGGVGLARGYLNRPGATAEKFIPNHFSPEPGERLYRTGDLVRWLPDGTLEYLGRIDHQVKVRGYRIELGEIESVLLAHASVRDAVVVARDEGGSKRLLGYVAVGAAARADEAGLVNALRSRLLEQLPGYMVPSVFVVLERLPLTANGKLDRKALPVPEASDLLKSQYVAPGTATEEKLCALWEEVLKVDRVGMQDNFFQLGGHSLLAVRLISRVRETFDVELPVRTLFENGTVGSLTAEVVECLIQKRSLENAEAMMTSPEMEEIIL
jgi:amino acid adenylation domain-containing protein